MEEEEPKPSTLINSLSLTDLSRHTTVPPNPPRRKAKDSGTETRQKRASSRRSIHPEIPLLKWKFDKSNGKNNSVEGEEKLSGEVRRKTGTPVVSPRKLGAVLCRLDLPEFPTNAHKRLGLQKSGGRHNRFPTHGHYVGRTHSLQANNMVHSSHYVSRKNGLRHEFEQSFQFSNSAMSIGHTSCQLKQTFGQTKLLNQQTLDPQVIPSLEKQLEWARARINDLETERKSSKKKLEQFLQKLSEEGAVWRSREHEKTRAIMDDLKIELSREKKNRQRLEIVNSKLINELADTKLSAKCYLHEYKKERKAREMTEEVCNELAEEIGEVKAEVEKLKIESKRLCEEVEEERKMLQIAEVWHEERVQMKLVDAKVMLEEKYSQMNRIIAEIEAFLSSKSTKLDLEEMKRM